MTKVQFGAKQVSKEEKQKLVKGVFSRVAPSYDRMNDVMSFGLHRFWKKYFVYKLLQGKKTCLLDLAGGTGDIARSYIKQGGESAIVCDFTYNMIQVGQNLASSQIYMDRLHWVQGDGESLPIKNNSVDLMSMVFGLRNTTNPEIVVNEAWRVLKPGGKFHVMEFSKPTSPLFSKVYTAYNKNILPLLGKVIAKDEAAYNYLQESIISFADKDTVVSWFDTAGFIRCKTNTLSGGIVTVYSGLKG